MRPHGNSPAWCLLTDKLIILSVSLTGQINTPVHLGLTIVLNREAHEKLALALYDNPHVSRHFTQTTPYLPLSISDMHKPYRWCSGFQHQNARDDRLPVNVLPTLS